MIPMIPFCVKALTGWGSEDHGPIGQLPLGPTPERFYDVMAATS
jgi:hypothetical protein